ncbi:hypothetical protein M231_02334 [Tremella mesenterica]|uniref:Uncharacterized protein n=3 Tax=Tremella mesenterica TaxID=5217 RepID=A0A4Q1BQX3_TREME|nr:hypothetical protein M231_02334 [Tremella mesenterica]
MGLRLIVRDPGLKRNICKQCGTVLIPGLTLKVRNRRAVLLRYSSDTWELGIDQIANKTHITRTTHTCLFCSTQRSIPSPPILLPLSIPPVPSSADLHNITGTTSISTLANTSTSIVSMGSTVPAAPISAIGIREEAQSERKTFDGPVRRKKRERMMRKTKLAFHTYEASLPTSDISASTTNPHDKEANSVILVSSNQTLSTSTSEKDREWKRNTGKVKMGDKVAPMSGEQGDERNGRDGKKGHRLWVNGEEVHGWGIGVPS